MKSYNNICFHIDPVKILIMQSLHTKNKQTFSNPSSWPSTISVFFPPVVYLANLKPRESRLGLFTHGRCCLSSLLMWRASRRPGLPIANGPIINALLESRKLAKYRHVVSVMDVDAISKALWTSENLCMPALSACSPQPVSSVSLRNLLSLCYCLTPFSLIYCESQEIVPSLANMTQGMVQGTWGVLCNPEVYIKINDPQLCLWEHPTHH